MELSTESLSLLFINKHQNFLEYMFWADDHCLKYPGALMGCLEQTLSNLHPLEALGKGLWPEMLTPPPPGVWGGWSKDVLFSWLRRLPGVRRRLSLDLEREELLGFSKTVSPLFFPHVSDLSSIFNPKVYSKVLLDTVMSLKYCEAGA